MRRSRAVKFAFDSTDNSKSVQLGVGWREVIQQLTQMSTVLTENLDLSRVEDVQTYLTNTPFASTRIEALSGGNANFVFRLHLATPYEGRSTLVLKHAKAWVKFDKNFALDVQRQVRDHDNLLYPTRSPPLAIV